MLNLIFDPFDHFQVRPFDHSTSVIDFSRRRLRHLIKLPRNELQKLRRKTPCHCRDVQFLWEKRRRFDPSPLQGVEGDGEGGYAMEAVGFGVRERVDGVLNGRRHQRVVDDDKSFRFWGKGAEEGGERAAEVRGRGAEGWDQVGGELVGGSGVRRRARERGDVVKVVEMDEVGAPAAVSGGDGAGDAADLGLAVVGGGTDEVDGDVEGGEEACEVEELVQMALRRERDHDDQHRRVVVVVPGGDSGGNGMVLVTHLMIAWNPKYKLFCIFLCKFQLSTLTHFYMQEEEEEKRKKKKGKKYNFALSHRFSCVPIPYGA